MVGVPFKLLVLGVAAACAVALAFGLTRGKQVIHETSVQPVAVNSAFVPSAKPQRPAFTAAEESYIAALWAVHDKVKSSAVKLTFAGLYYKTGELDRAELKKRTSGQTEVFRAAAETASATPVPASFQKLHQEYLGALKAYEEASIEMAKTGDDGADSHLIGAQEKTQKAAVTLLKVGDQLWPGEYKPN
jgi:hypothetical protein